jgi:hypothetical protein
MSTEKKPMLMIVAGREGPTEGPHSNAAKIAAVAAKFTPKRGRKKKPKTAPPADIAFIGNAKPDLWAEAGIVLSKLNVKGRMPEAVKCLHLLLTKNVSATALLVRKRGASKSNVLSTEEFQAKIEQLDEYNQQYIAGYMQGLIDRRVT